MDFRNCKDLIGTVINLFIVIDLVNPLILIKLQIYLFSCPFWQLFFLLFQFLVFHMILLLFIHIFSQVQVQVWEVLALLLVLEGLVIKQRLIQQYFLVNLEEPFIKKPKHKLHKLKQCSLEQQEDLELQPQDFFYLFSELILQFLMELFN